MYCYKVTDGEAAILECRDLGSAAVIPAQLDGYPVTELAPYSFSEKKNPIPETGTLRFGKEGAGIGSGKMAPPDLRGDRLTEVYLPETLKKIGNYAFYNCGRLERIHCKSSIADIGSGVFTGCTGVGKLDIEIVREEKSCLKEILSELRQEIYVNYNSPQGEARLVFPEFYEESVENTPARKLSVQMHGCGHLYRNCFHGTDFLFREYDSLFPFALALEREELTVRMAMGRLWKPLELTKEAGENYGAYVKSHLRQAGREALKRRGIEQFSWLAKTLAACREDLDILLEAAAERKDAAAVGWLMDYRHRAYPAGARKFSL